MTIAVLLMHFDITLVNTVHGGPPKEVLSFTLMLPGLRMWLEPRGAGSRSPAAHGAVGRIASIGLRTLDQRFGPDPALSLDLNVFDFPGVLSKACRLYPSGFLSGLPRAMPWPANCYDLYTPYRRSS